ncbi:hypothetical protein SEPCBS119000_005612 [Sporothrix epigloea]|uniref:Uncharacterized protein n=1 Tax=Sporothrix epigloea TaxID=1892477 RepID=A0ABP0E0T1_9PEZI
MSSLETTIRKLNEVAVVDYDCSSTSDEDIPTDMTTNDSLLDSEEKRREEDERRREEEKTLLQLRDAKAEALVWLHRPYSPDSYDARKYPEPTELMVRMVFPGLSPSDKVPDYDSYDPCSIVDMPPGIPVFDSFSDPDLVKKLTTAQDVLTRHYIPTSQWGRYLYTKLTGDFKELAELVIYKVKWHHCVWAVITCERGLGRYIMAREASLRASQAAPEVQDFQQSWAEMCRRYREAPILLVPPTSRLLDLELTLDTWLPLIKESAFDDARKLTDAFLSGPNRFLHTIRSLEIDVRMEFEDKVAFHAFFNRNSDNSGTTTRDCDQEGSEEGDTEGDSAAQFPKNSRDEVRTPGGRLYRRKPGPLPIYEPVEESSDTEDLTEREAEEFDQSGLLFR